MRIYYTDWMIDGQESAIRKRFRAGIYVEPISGEHGMNGEEIDYFFEPGHGVVIRYKTLRSKYICESPNQPIKEQKLTPGEITINVTHGRPDAKSAVEVIIEGIFRDSELEIDYET